MRDISKRNRKESLKEPIPSSSNTISKAIFMGFKKCYEVHTPSKMPFLILNTGGWVLKVGFCEVPLNPFLPKLGLESVWCAGNRSNMILKKVLLVKLISRPNSGLNTGNS